MKILIVSDTHGNHRNFDKMLAREGEIDMLLHLGDVEGGELYIEGTAGCPVYFVSGNNDFFANLPLEEELQIGKYKILMTHGHAYHVSRGTGVLRRVALERGIQIAMYGHTHRSDLEEDKDLIILNPGSLSYSREHGVKGSYIVMEIGEDGEAEFTLKYL